MSIATQTQLSPFAADVLSGLTGAGPKKLPPKYFYDALGSKLFEAITLLPEYGLTRADTRLLERAAKSISETLGSPCLVAELGSGSGKKTSHILGAIAEPALQDARLVTRPSRSLLTEYRGERRGVSACPNASGATGPMPEREILPRVLVADTVHRIHAREHRGPDARDGEIPANRRERSADTRGVEFRQRPRARDETQ